MSLPISGFTAVPNPQMLAFMAAQSFVMMMQAGEGWQYGKRKQSAMTNEEFNKQTPISIMQRQMSELKEAIPTIEENMNNMTPMIRTIVIQYGDFMKEIISALPPALTAALGGQTLEGNISTVGKEFADILKSIIPSIPEAEATLVTNNPNPPPPSLSDIKTDKNISGSELITSFNQIEYQKRLDASVKAAEEKARQAIPSTKVLSASVDPVYIAWIAKLGKLKAEYTTINNTIKQQIALGYNISNDRKLKSLHTKTKSKKFDIVKAIRRMSNDYRNPNKHIGENVLRLRQAMANGQWV